MRESRSGLAYLQRNDEAVHDGSGKGFHSRFNRFVTQTNSCQRRTNFLCCAYMNMKQFREHKLANVVCMYDVAMSI